MAYISRLIFLIPLLFISNSAFAEFDEVYWEFNGQKFATPNEAYMSWINSQNNSIHGNCQLMSLTAQHWELLSVEAFGNNSSAKYRVCNYGGCILDCSGATPKDLSGAVKRGVCRPGRVYNSNTYQCQDPCPNDDAWQDVESRPGLGWNVSGIYGCNGGCLVRYDAYTDLVNFSTNVRGKHEGDLWMCSSDYCFGREQLSSKCGYRYVCPEGALINADGSCSSPQCPAGTVSNGAGGCRQECDQGETWDGTACVLPACPLGQHREDGACVDNQCPAGQIQDPVTKDCINPEDPGHQCPAGMSKNLNGECATDSDGDGKPDDSDGDGTPDDDDDDDDNDGTPDDSDPDSDGDGNPDQCPAGQVKDSNGNCGFPNYDQCPVGTVKDVNGNCVPGNTDNPDNPQQCPAGQVKDSSGNCVTDNPNNPDNPQQCPAGQVKDSNGNCVMSGGSGDNGGGSGSGSDSASSSANCETAPQCQGDPIQCAALKQTWKTGCMLVQENPDEDQQEKVEFTEIEVSTSINSGILGGGGGSCPSDRIVIIAGKQIPISFSAVCQFASLIRAIILILAGIAAVRIVMGVNVKGA